MLGRGDVLMQSASLSIDGLAFHPTLTEPSTIRQHLKRHPILKGYGSEVDAVLRIMEHCRRWLPEGLGEELCNAALLHNDAIYQVVSYYGANHLVTQFVSHTGLEKGTDVQMIAAYALANAVHALCGLVETLSHQAREIPALELYQTHLDSIVASVPSASVWLDPDEHDACCKIGELAASASRHAGTRIAGSLSGASRRQEGLDSRDRDIVAKALELFSAGTARHNLNSKLRAWQERETGKSLSKVQMGQILKGLRCLPSTRPSSPKKK